MAESSTPTFTRTSPAATELLWTKPCCSMEAEAVAQATLHLMAPPAVTGSATCLCELTLMVFLINMSYSAICKTSYLLSGIPYPSNGLFHPAQLLWLQLCPRSWPMLRA